MLSRYDLELPLLLNASKDKHWANLNAVDRSIMERGRGTDIYVDEI